MGRARASIHSRPTGSHPHPVPAGIRLMVPYCSADMPGMARLMLRWWAPFVGITGGALAILSLGPDRTAGWKHPELLFCVILVLTVACAVGAAAVVVLGIVRRLAEVTLLGSALWVVSLLPMIHGLLLPGHLYGQNSGSAVALMAAVPGALLAGLPLLLD